VALSPPKHLGIPDESTLHTAFWPSQQFWEALMKRVPPSGSLPAPQTLPLALQDTPVSHQPSEHRTLGGLIPPPQQLPASLQTLPVVSQPLSD
jgi:hypothetical protein